MQGADLDKTKTITSEQPSNIYIDTGKFKAILSEVLTEKLNEREKANRSFWRAVGDVVWSGMTQAHSSWQKLFKE